MKILSASRLSGLLIRVRKFFFTGIRMGLSVLWKSITRKQGNKPLSSLYLHTRETPLEVFIDALVNKNLSRLIKYGRASQRQLAEAWETLFAEYCEISGSTQYQRLINLTKEIGSLQSKLLSIQVSIRVLGFRYSSKSISTLARFGYKYRFDIQDPESYTRDVKSVLLKSKSVELALDQSLVEYQKLISSTDEKPLTEEYFEKALVELSKFMGFRVDPRQVTVSEYVAMLKRREKEIELLSKQVPNKKAHGYNY